MAERKSIKIVFGLIGVMLMIIGLYANSRKGNYIISIGLASITVSILV